MLTAGKGREGNLLPLKWLALHKKIKPVEENMALIVSSLDQYWLHKLLLPFCIKCFACKLVSDIAERWTGTGGEHVAFLLDFLYLSTINISCNKVMNVKD